MAQNVVINSVVYQNCPEVDIPKQGGGTAKFMDTSDADAAAGDIRSGKYAYVNGTKLTGSLSVPSVSQDSTTKILTIS